MDRKFSRAGRPAQTALSFLNLPTQAERSVQLQRASNEELFSWRFVRLGDLAEKHPALTSRDRRLNLALGSLANVALWHVSTLRIAMHVMAPICIERGSMNASPYMVVASGQLLPMLHKVLRPDVQVPIRLITDNRRPEALLHLCAATELCIAAAAARLQVDPLRSIVEDASRDPYQLLHTDQNSIARAIGI